MSRVASRIVRRGGVFQYRRRVPDDVRKLGGFSGKEIVQVSLRTSDPVAARREAARQEGLFERECARLRGFEIEPTPPINQGVGMVLTDAYLKAIQDRYVAVGLAEDVRETLAAQSDPELQEYLDSRDDWLAPAYRADADGNIIDKAGTDARRRLIEIEELRRNIAPFASHHAGAFGAVPGSVEFTRIENAFIEAELKIIEARPDQISAVDLAPVRTRTPRPPRASLAAFRD